MLAETSLRKEAPLTPSPLSSPPEGERDRVRGRRIRRGGYQSSYKSIR
jgi:hypothetical protein